MTKWELYTKYICCVLNYNVLRKNICGGCKLKLACVFTIQQFNLKQ